MTTTKSNRRVSITPGRRRLGPRRLKPRPAEPVLPDLPYTMRLKDGRTIFVEVPGKWVTRDRGGEIGLLPPAVRFLDRIRVLAMSPGNRPATPGYLATLRVALGFTPREFAARLGVDKLTVSRWERGAVNPSAESLAAIENIRKESVAKGVTINPEDGTWQRS
jgi:DNA-binding XRE family transcriptional regulator